MSDLKTIFVDGGEYVDRKSYIQMRSDLRTAEEMLTTQTDRADELEKYANQQQFIIDDLLKFTADEQIKHLKALGRQLLVLAWRDHKSEEEQTLLEHAEKVLNNDEAPEDKP